MGRFKVIVDTREQNPWSFEEDNYCLGQTIQKLDTGDYSLEGLDELFFIERKSSVSEIAHNINEKRWPAWLERTSEFRHKFIICEFGHYDINMFPMQLPEKVRSKIKITPKYIYKCIAQMELKFGLHISLCNNRETAFNYAYCLMKRMTELYG